jgi:starch synthase (maltosyl-transferring)
MDRIVIEDVFPVVAGGRYPAKATVGERVEVGAVVWREGHDRAAATLVWYAPGDPRPRAAPMIRGTEPDSWHGTVAPDRPGLWTFRVDGWGDPWATWRHAIESKVDAGRTAEELWGDFEVGARLLDRATRTLAVGRADLNRAAAAVRDTTLPPAVRVAAAARVHDRMAGVVREFVTPGRPYQIWVDRARARFGSWYEFFPRSTGGRDATGAPVHGTFATAAAQLDRIAAMGFDVVYLPPIHPIGSVHRKGPNNTLTAGPGDPGSPWAIGSVHGGHDAVHPELGTIEDFDAFVGRARELGLEVALDLALQCAPDHPWARDHPEWFTVTPDGSIAYAENPPKRYQDIYPINFDNRPDSLYQEILRVVLHWVDHGVRVFRVDNPHTKPPNFWHWLIWRVKSRHPDVLFLAEAFTQPSRLYGLARLGFSQSYTYFTWRSSAAELRQFGTDLIAHADELRPNLFVNTPDILTEELQRGGPAMFAARAALAATLSPTWGVYSGYELYESEPLHEGSEEYLDSEKYQLRPRDYARASVRGTSLEPWLRRLNEIRRDHPALAQLRTLRFHPTDNDALIAYSKTDPGSGDAVLVVVNLDPDRPQAATVHCDLTAIGAAGPVTVLDEVTGERFEWGEHTYVRLDPERAVAHIAGVLR